MVNWERLHRLSIGMPRMAHSVRKKRASIVNVSSDTAKPCLCSLLHRYSPEIAYFRASTSISISWERCGTFVYLYIDRHICIFNTLSRIKWKRTPALAFLQTRPNRLRLWVIKLTKTPARVNPKRVRMGAVVPLMSQRPGGLSCDRWCWPEENVLMIWFVLEQGVDG